MSRAAQGNAQNLYNESQNVLNQSQTNANNLYNQLAPAYTNEAINPQGFGKSTLADMTTSAEQSAGGALGASEGAAKTGAAANRNSGSFAPSLDQAARDSSKNLSNINLGINDQNAMLKQQQQQQGLEGLSGLDSQQNSNILGSIGLGTSANNSLVNAGNSGWFQNMLGLISALKPSGQVTLPQSQGSGSGPGDDTEEEANSIVEGGVA